VRIPLIGGGLGGEPETATLNRKTMFDLLAYYVRYVEPSAVVVYALVDRDEIGWQVFTTGHRVRTGG
jgi:hypothetical protein